MRIKFNIIIAVFILFLAGLLFAQPRTCNYCGKEIKGKYIVFENRNYHVECYKQVQTKCAYCNKPIEGKYISKDGKKYHEKCYFENVALKCDLCEKIIEGYYITDYWGNNYHREHEENEWRCDYCGRFISPGLTGGGVQYNDGRTICNLCKKSSVINDSKAEAIVSDVRRGLEKFGIVINYGRIDVRLVNRNELRKLANKSDDPSDTRGFAFQQYWTQNGKIVKREFVIYLLNGMPQKDLEAVAAHELMHLWQYLNSPTDVSLQLIEGSCEYAAYLYLTGKNDTYSQFLIHKIETNGNPIYGEGFKRVKNLVDKTSVANWLKILKQYNDFPRGY